MKSLDHRIRRNNLIRDALFFHLSRRDEDPTEARQRWEINIHDDRQTTTVTIEGPRFVESDELAVALSGHGFNHRGDYLHVESSGSAKQTNAMLYNE